MLSRAKLLGRIALIFITSFTVLFTAESYSWGFMLRYTTVIGGGDYMPQILWTRGCSPTAGAMVLGYWDNYSYYNGGWMGNGRLIDYWQDLSKYVDGRLESYGTTSINVIRNVPNILDELREAMHTDADGNTGDVLHNDIASGILSVANNPPNNYCFNTRSYVGTVSAGNYWDRWAEIKHEIDGSRPFIWSVQAYLYPDNELANHSVAVWGYGVDEANPDNRYLILYDPNYAGTRLWNFTMFDGDWRQPIVTELISTVEPGCADGANNIDLSSPSAGQTLTGDTSFPISWYQNGSTISNVSIFYSTDAGASWSLIQNRPSSQGWNNYAWIVPNINSSTVRFKVEGFDPSGRYIAGDGSGSSSECPPTTGAVTSCGNSSIVIDVYGPTGTVSINNGANYANSKSVTLNLSASDPSGVSQMQFWDNISGAWTTPEPYSTAKSWTLSDGDGYKWVYVKFKDNKGNWSDSASDFIILDTTGPTGSVSINGGAAVTNCDAVTLSISASDANDVSWMAFINEFGTSSSEPYATTKNWTLSAGDGTKTVYVIVSDNAGNWSYFSDSIILDQTYLPVRIGGTYYLSLQEAYNAAYSGAVIQSRDATLTGDLNANLPITVTLDGGYNCYYSSKTGSTRVKGMISTNDGATTIKDFVLEQ